MSGFDDRIVIPKKHKQKRKPKPPRRRRGCGCGGCLGGCLGMIIFLFLIGGTLYYLGTRGYLNRDLFRGNQTGRIIEELGLFFRDLIRRGIGKITEYI